MLGLRLDGVSKSYGKAEVVCGVDLDVSQGEFVVILGPSGCGKSTLLRMIAGLEDVSAGQIEIAGQIVTHLPPRRRECAMVFQNYALYPHLTVRDNIGYPLHVAGVAKSEIKARVIEVARIVSLGDYLDRKPSQLSGGQRQRVAMGRAIVRKPKLFLFDEPLSNLDAKLRVQMRAEIRQLQERLGVTSVFVTHDQVEAMTLADRIVVMNAGRIEQVGPPTEVYRRPASRYVASFVGAQPMSFLDGFLSSDGGGLEIPGAGSIPLGFTAPPDERGRPVVVGLRAEAVRVAGPETGTLRGTVVFTEELGPHAIHHVQVGAVEVLAQGVSGTLLHDANVLLSVEAPVHLFEPKTGRRVEFDPALAAA
ncbi:ABC transporter ATP-binding protein [Methylocapsa sp. S129]|uniref:ABC transporter ATP-binding protein n=1 Tax=Methylocapsa sp. S129 TaxID=1641869 RepID=UPI00131DADB0|nr:sn-glycerol-3-phosphate ABC transporter ATP-binding protein UgpC [Methylocapsa sp. S129]